MDNQLSAHWLNNELPGINCVIKSTGEIILLNAYTNEEGKPYAFPLCETTIESLVKYNEDIWTEIQVFARITNTKTGDIFCCGEGAMGNEGFIACTSSANHFIWGVFFEHSNPFSKLTFHENELRAYSTSDYVYIIDLNNPECIQIEELVK
jgi:hypothetical protein